MSIEGERDIYLSAPRNDSDINEMSLTELKAQSAFLNQWGAYNPDDQGWEAVMKKKEEIDEEIRIRESKGEENGE
jgi:hypothetical protein